MIDLLTISWLIERERSLNRLRGFVDLFLDVDA